MNHELESVTRVADNQAEWLCVCGKKGVSMCAPHLVNHIDVEARAAHNHEMHQVRAMIKEKNNA